MIKKAIFLGGCVLAVLVFFKLLNLFDDTIPPTREEVARAVAQCSGQRIGDPAFRFPYNITCDEWVKIKVGDNEYTQQYLEEYKKPAEK